MKKRFSHKGMALIVVTLMCLTFILPLTQTTFAAPPSDFYISTPRLELPQDLNADGKAPLKLRLVYEPLTADVSGQEWISSDPAVATVDNLGNVEMLTPGITTISVKIGAQSSSDGCVLTVLPAENRSIAAKNLLNLPVQDNRIDKWAFTKWPTNYGEAVIALWEDDKQGAFSITADDGHFEDIWRWNEIMERWGGGITMCISPIFADFATKADKNGNTYADLIRAGGEVQSHSLAHAGGGVRAAWTTADYFFDLYESRDLVQKVLMDLGVDDISISQTYLNADGTWPADYVRKFYSAARNGSVISASPPDYAALASASSFEGMNIDVSILELINPAVKNGTAADSNNRYGGMSGRLVHQIHDSKSTQEDGGLQAGLYYSERLEWVFENYMHPNRSILWYGTLSDMSNYAQERDSATLVVDEATGDSVKFTVTDYLDDTYFHYPLTVKVKLDDSWTQLTATQAGGPTDVQVLKRGGNVYAMVKAVPDAGQVVLSKSGAAVNISGDATLAKLEYRPNPGQVINNLRKDVPGFTAGSVPNPSGYDILLPPGTAKVAIYGTPTDDAATSLRNPVMGIVNVSAAEGPKTATVTVTAQDGTVNEYRVTFTVSGYLPIESMEVAVKNFKGGAPSLDQVTTSETVYFEASAQREETGPDGNPIRWYDPNTIEWYVNDVKQSVKGFKFDYTPIKYGEYTVYAKAGGVDSDPTVITFTKGAPKPIEMLWDCDFEDTQYVVDQPIPLTNSADPATPMWAERNNIVGPSGIPSDWKSMDIAELPEQGKVARWTSTNPGDTAAISKLIPMDRTNPQPLVISGKVMIEGVEKTGYNPFSIMMSNQWNQRSGAFAGMGHNGQFTWTAGGWTGGWAFGKWVNFITVVDPLHYASNGNYVARTYIGNSNPSDTAFRASVTNTGLADNWTNANGNTRAAIFSFTGIYTKVPGDYGNYSSYLDDVKIYRPGSFVMSPAKEVFELNDKIRMNFSHHADLTTLTAARVSVKDSAGNTVQVQGIETNNMQNDYFIINFAPNTLKEGVTYTVSLSADVRDILDKTIYDDAAFTISDDAPITPELTVSNIGLIKKAGVNTVTANVKNTFGEQKSLPFIIAVYDGNKLIDVKSAPQNIAAGHSDTLEFALPIAALQDGYKVKVMVLDTATMAPLCRALEKTVRDII